MFTYSERVKELNIPKAVAGQLAELDIGFQWTFHDRSERLDGEATFNVDGQLVTVRMELKSQLRPSTVPLILNRVSPGDLVIAEYISSSVGEQLHAHGVHYADTVGNVSLRGQGVRLLVEGRRPPKETAPAADANLYTPAALPVLMVMLNRPELLGHPLREIQARVDVSLGTVQRVVRSLRNSAYHSPTGDPWGSIFQGWLTAYLSGPRDRGARRFQSDLPVAELLNRVPASTVAVSGEAAAALLGHDIRPSTADLYVDGPVGPVIKAARLRADPEGPVWLRKMRWTELAEQDDAAAVAGRRLAPAPIRYADLVAHPDPRLTALSREVATSEPVLRRLIRH